MIVIVYNHGQKMSDFVVPASYQKSDKTLIIMLMTCFMFVHESHSVNPMVDVNINTVLQSRCVIMRCAILGVLDYNFKKISTTILN